MPPYSNSTVGLPAADAAAMSDAEVPGPTIFWALLALALNAMAQDSPTARVIFEYKPTVLGLFTPHLSSPLICLVDVFVDICKIIYILGHALIRTTQSTSDGEETSIESKPSSSILQVTGIRALLVLFGVIPQAIRLYSITSNTIPQIIATIYLATSLIRLLQIVLSTQLNEITSPATPAFLGRRLTDAIYVAMITFHLQFYATFWTIFSVLISSQGPSESMKYIAIALIWIGRIGLSIGLLGAILWTINVVFTDHKFHQHYRPAYLLFFGAAIGYLGAYLNNPAPDLTIHIPFGIFSPTMIRLLPPLLGAMFVSWLFAGIMAAVSRLSKEEDATHEMDTISPDHVSSTSSQPSNNITDGLTNETMQQPIYEMDATSLHNIRSILSQPSNNVADDLTNETTQRPIYETNVPPVDKSLATQLRINATASIYVAINDQAFREEFDKNPRLKHLSTRCQTVAWLLRQSCVTLPKAIVQAILFPQDSAGDASTGRSRLSLTAIQIGKVLFIFGCHTIVFCIIFLQAFFELGSWIRPIKRFLSAFTDLSTSFALFNLITAGMWYAKCYNSKGTTMPEWSTWFG